MWSIPKTSSRKGFDALEKVLILCQSHKISQAMRGQLEKRNIKVFLVTDAQKLISQLNASDPEMILIDMNLTAEQSVEQIVEEVFVWMRKQARNINKVLNSPSHYLWQRSIVVLFKSDEEMPNPIVSLTGEIMDTDDIVRQCSLLGDVHYIGLYSSFSFIAKIRVLMK